MRDGAGVVGVWVGKERMAKGERSTRGWLWCDGGECAGRAAGPG